MGIAVVVLPVLALEARLLGVVLVAAFLARDPKALGSRVCFVHTGGLFSLFPYRERLSRLIDRRG